MIISIEKAILHILMPSTGTSVYSDKELTISEGDISSYLSNHIERAFDMSVLRKGSFNSSSYLKGCINTYLSKNLKFTELSRSIAEKFDAALLEAEKAKPADVAIIEFSSNERKMLGILKFNSKYGYSHQIQKQGEDIQNKIVDNYSILPSRTQKIAECAFIDLGDYSILYSDKKYNIGGEHVGLMADIVLDCICETASDKEICAAINTNLKVLSSDPIEASAVLKEHMLKTIDRQGGEEGGIYTLQEVADDIFSSPSDRANFIERSKSVGIAADGNEELPIGEYTIKKTNEPLKIVTDTGVELKIPVGVYRRDMEINIAEDGKSTITIQNVGSLELK